MIFYIMVPFFLIQMTSLIADQTTKKDNRQTAAPAAASASFASTSATYKPISSAPIKKNGAIKSKLQKIKQQVAAKKTNNKSHSTKSTISSSSNQDYHEQKKSHHTWPKKNSLIKKLEETTQDIPQRTKENGKNYREKISIAFTSYKALYDYNRTAKMFVTEEENHRIMQAVEKLFKHKHIENMVWHANLLKN